ELMPVQPLGCCSPPRTEAKSRPGNDSSALMAPPSQLERCPPNRVNSTDRSAAAGHPTADGIGIPFFLLVATTPDAILACSGLPISDRPEHGQKFRSPLAPLRLP